MFKLIVRLAPFSFLLLLSGTKCYCQQNFAPYLGVSGSIDKNEYPGWGVEGGLRFYQFYAGFEYGGYAYNWTNCNYCDLPPGPPTPWTPRPDASEPEQFWGIHAGYVLNKKFYIGAVILSSYQLWLDRFDTTTYSWLTETRNYLNIGPDFRYSGIDHGHLYLAFALTIRRGLKAGLGYIF